MLNLIIGRIGSGKTTRLHEKIKEAVSHGENAVLVVPEQYSFCTEKMMLELLGAEKAHNVEVVSFSFMARNILKKHGMNCLQTLDDSTRTMLMSLALESVQDKLEVFGKHKYSACVISGMIKTIKDFRQSSVTSEMAMSAADKLPDSLIKSKIEEISLVMDAYTAITQQSFFDEESALDRLCDVLDDCQEFKDKTVFVDGFRGYTAQEMNVLKRIFVQSSEIYITLCTDKHSDGDSFSHFAHTNRTKRKLIALANKCSVKVAVPEYIEEFDERRYTNQELAVLEKSLYASDIKQYTEKTEHITLCAAEDFEAECNYVACMVKKIIRTKNLRCRDIAIISRVEENYSRQIRSALRKHGVPVFEDRRQPVSSQPLIEFVCSAVDIATKGFSTDSIMRTLKTGLSDISIDDISELENYSLLWKINGNRWLDSWTGHPDGLGEKMLEKDEKRLASINETRRKVIMPLQKFRESFKDINGLSAAQKIYQLLVDMNVAENLKKLAERLDAKNETELAIEQGRMWDVLIEILDRMAASLEKINLTASRFNELFNLVVSTYTVGTMPQGLDEIIIGTADRVKTTAPKIVFVVGMNDGVFPMIPVSNGILSDNDKKILAQLDLNTDDSLEQKMMEEQFIAYSTLCSPSDSLYITYSGKDVMGAQLTESEIVTKIRDIFPALTCVDTINVDDKNMIEGVIPAFELMAKLTQNGGITYNTLEKYFRGRDDYSGKLKALSRAVKKEKFEINDKEIAKKLFGMNMYMSASRTEVYNKCPFEYFCKYGLSANPRKVAELDPMQKGTALHYILEKLIMTYGSDGLCKMEKKERDAHVMHMLDDYLNDNMSAGSELDERFVYLCRQLGIVACEVVDRLVSEFSVSEFVPVAFELKIDNDGEVKTYDIKLPDGGVLKLKGSIDRVDVMQGEKDTFVRVVDYKSGGKSFDLNEVFSGLNMQMLIYLFALWKNGFREYKNITPAGILYMPVKAPVINVERDEDENVISSEKQKSVKMTGMVLDDSRVIYSMDSQAKGKFIPAKIDAKGSCSGNIISLKNMGILMKRVEKILADMAVNLHEGKIEVSPAKAIKTTSPYNDVCAFCDYHDVCCSDEDTPVREIEKIDHRESIEKLGGDEDA